MPQFYRQALGVKVEMLMHYKDSPEAPPPGVLQVPKAAARNLVLLLSLVSRLQIPVAGRTRIELSGVQLDFRGWLTRPRASQFAWEA